MPTRRRTSCLCPPAAPRCPALLLLWDSCPGCTLKKAIAPKRAQCSTGDFSGGNLLKPLGNETFGNLFFVTQRRGGRIKKPLRTEVPASTAGWYSPS